MDRYRPRLLSEIEDSGISIINEPVLPNVAVLVPRSARGIRAVLIENLNAVEALINRLEQRGVSVCASDRGVIRSLYESACRQRDVLSAALGIADLE